jgi:hypothetical protein
VILLGLEFLARAKPPHVLAILLGLELLTRVEPPDILIQRFLRVLIFLFLTHARDPTPFVRP